MSKVCQKQPQQLPANTSEISEWDLIHELGRRLTRLWDCERFIINARGCPELLEFWQSVSSQEQANVARLKVLLKHYAPTD